MPRIRMIQQWPTVVDKRHESLFRAYKLLDYVRELLELGTPNSVILEIIETCYEDDPIIRVRPGVGEDEAGA